MLRGAPGSPLELEWRWSRREAMAARDLGHLLPVLRPPDTRLSLIPFTVPLARQTRGRIVG